MPDSRRTFASYKAQVLHALGNPDEAEMDISPGAIVNDALEHIAAMHEWRWLTTNQATLDLVADQPYVELPADFGTLTAIEHDNAWSRQMVPTTWANLLALRKDPVTSWTSGYFYVIQTGNVEEGDEDAGLSLPTLELHPTPADDLADAISIVYRRVLRRLGPRDGPPTWIGRSPCSPARSPRPITTTRPNPPTRPSSHELSATAWTKTV